MLAQADHDRSTKHIMRQETRVARQKIHASQYNSHSLTYDLTGQETRVTRQKIHVSQHLCDCITVNSLTKHFKRQETRNTPDNQTEI